MRSFVADMLGVEIQHEHTAARIGRELVRLRHRRGFDERFGRPRRRDDNVLETVDLLRRVVLEHLEVLRLQVLHRRAVFRRVHVHAHQVCLSAESWRGLRRRLLLRRRGWRRLRLLGETRRFGQESQADNGENGGTRELEHGVPRGTGGLARRSVLHADAGVWNHAVVSASLVETLSNWQAAGWRHSCNSGPFNDPEAQGMRKADEWTIESWKTEPRIIALEFSDTSVDQAPPLWKDLTLASALAVLLWGAAAVVLG